MSLRSKIVKVSNESEKTERKPAPGFFDGPPDAAVSEPAPTAAKPVEHSDAAEQPQREPASFLSAAALDASRAGGTDPLLELSTFRAIRGPSMTPEQLAARKAAQEKRALAGLVWMANLL
jgi:hypothetical protein